MDKLIKFLNELESKKIFYKLDKTNDEYIMVEITVPGEKWEIEFSDHDTRIERFVNDGKILDESAIKILFDKFSD